MMKLTKEMMMAAGLAVSFMPGTNGVRLPGPTACEQLLFGKPTAKKPDAKPQHVPKPVQFEDLLFGKPTAKNAEAKPRRVPEPVPVPEDLLDAAESWIDGVNGWPARQANDGVHDDNAPHTWDTTEDGTQRCKMITDVISFELNIKSSSVDNSKPPLYVTGLVQHNPRDQDLESVRIPKLKGMVLKEFNDTQVKTLADYEKALSGSLFSFVLLFERHDYPIEMEQNLDILTDDPEADYLTLHYPGGKISTRFNKLIRFLRRGGNEAEFGQVRNSNDDVVPFPDFGGPLGMRHRLFACFKQNARQDRESRLQQYFEALSLDDKGKTAQSFIDRLKAFQNNL